MIDEQKLIEDIAEYMRNVYDCDLEDVVGFQTNNESKSAYIVQGLYEAVSIIDEQPKVGEWIPCKIVDHPEHCRDCEVTRKDTIGVVRDIAFYAIGGWRRTADETPVDVIAWKEPSRPYKE